LTKLANILQVMVRNMMKNCIDEIFKNPENRGKLKKYCVLLSEECITIDELKCLILKDFNCGVCPEGSEKSLNENDMNSFTKQNFGSLSDEKGINGMGHEEREFISYVQKKFHSLN